MNKHETIEILKSLLYTQYKYIEIRNQCNSNIIISGTLLYCYQFLQTYIPIDEYCDYQVNILIKN